MKSKKKSKMPDHPILRKGDIFLSRNPMWLGRIINKVQGWWARDSRSVYGHAGIVMRPEGKTFEARWKNDYHHLDDYAGSKVLVARHEDMDGVNFVKGFREICSLKGKWYAGHRLFLFLFPPLARRLNVFGLAVCSEIVAKFLCGAGMMHYWIGINPDDLHEVLSQWKGWEIIYEGEWPQKR